MAETSKPPTSPLTKTTTPSPSVWTFDATKLKAHLEKIIEFQNKFVGKKNHNPFLWIKNNVTPLFNRLTGKEQTKELHDAIMKLPLEEAPVVLKEEVKQSEPEAPKLVMTNAGIMLQEDAKNKK